MSLINYRHIIGRENNIVRVDFARESDPPAPKFPGANGLRPVNVPVLPPPLRARRPIRTVKVSVA
jgi:hypothetical protein